MTSKRWCMATILLVHGSWHGGRVWNNLRSAPAASGHRVHAPSLRGLAEDAANLRPDIADAISGKAA